MLVGGSVASGKDDLVSDLDLWVKASAWSPQDAPGLLLAAQAMTIGGLPFFHGVDAAGVIVDVMVGEEPWANYVPVEGQSNCVPGMAVLEPQDLYSEFWINSYKNRKPLFRNLASMCLFGLHIERMLLLRAWVAEDTGADPGPSVFSIHALGPIVTAHMTDDRQRLLGLPARTLRELVEVIDAHRDEMSRLMPRGSSLMELVLSDSVYASVKRQILKN